MQRLLETETLVEQCDGGELRELQIGDALPGEQQGIAAEVADVGQGDGALFCLTEEFPCGEWEGEGGEPVQGPDLSQGLGEVAGQPSRRALILASAAPFRAGVKAISGLL
ncbi:hypothetical protein [Streptomyces sp. NBC_01445]|uniref:hypothetical protein n=1 Tax=Streptomyces sp. NBC_01445 TaxID=2903869 RepID=UPI002DDA91E8|nr:hypothetical protein [Streptomyces sp. NBC_01445]WSE03701.1 hypothetical protein OG574_10150 [Streptomyces sp. NBC_01445]